MILDRFIPPLCNHGVQRGPTDKYAWQRQLKAFQQRLCGFDGPRSRDRELKAVLQQFIQSPNRLLADALPAIQQRTVQIGNMHRAHGLLLVLYPIINIAVKNKDLHKMGRKTAKLLTVTPKFLIFNLGEV